MKAISIRPGTADSMALMDVPEPPMGRHDVLVKVMRVGVCGTDLELKQGLYGQAPPGSDHLIIGHEALGQVAETGAEVENFAAGDYVVASVRRPCRHDHCGPCVGGENDMCVTGDYLERGINRQHGFLSEFYSEHQRWLTKIPVPIEPVGVFLEPLSVVEKAMRQTFKIQERLPWKIENAVVLGAGTIGLLGAMLLRMKGINTYVLDRSESGGFKSRLIADLGAQHINSRETPLSEVAVDLGPIDFVLEATGYAPLAFQAFQHLGMNGLVCLLGVAGGSQEIAVDAMEFNNRMVLGNRLVFGSVNASLIDFRSGAEHLQQINQQWPGTLERMLTRRTSLAEFPAAFDRQPGDIKVVIEMDT
jgi:threonine dehydrogenase-like Zn-dependent dehydrogenase